jgi:hypothetical protein
MGLHQNRRGGVRGRSFERAGRAIPPVAGPAPATRRSSPPPRCSRAGPRHLALVGDQIAMRLCLERLEGGRGQPVQEIGRGGRVGRRRTGRISLNH